VRTSSKNGGQRVRETDYTEKFSRAVKTQKGKKQKEEDREKERRKRGSNKTINKEGGGF